MPFSPAYPDRGALATAYPAVDTLGPAYPAGGFANLYSAKFVRASSQYASMTDANFGDWDRAKFAIAGFFELTSNGVLQYFISQWGASAADQAFIISINAANKLSHMTLDSGAGSTYTTTATYSTGVRYPFLFHYDSANATPALRKRIWVGSSTEITAFDTQTTVNGPLQSKVGPISYATVQGVSTLDGNLDEMLWVSGSLPSWGDIFDGSDNIKDVSGLAGLWSWARFENDWTDEVLATDWTPTNAPTFELN